MAEERATVTDVISKHLPCKLTDEERQDFGLQLAQSMQEYTAIEDEKKAEAARLGAKLQGARGGLNRLSEIVAQGYETRPVDCEKRVDTYLGKVKIVRIDTGEIVEDRAIRDEDLKLNMLPGRD